MAIRIFRAIPVDVRWKAVAMRTFLSILIIAISIYVVLMLMIYLFQGRMVFLSNIPGRTLDVSPANISLVFEEVSITTPDNERLHGWYVPAEDSGGVVLFFHGIVVTCQFQTVLSHY
jgi:hypothetical protein